MKRIDLMPLRQRVLLVIAIGAALLVVGGWVTDRRGVSSGWFGYAPDTAVLLHAGATMRPAVVALIQLGLIVIWAAVSLRLLRAPGEDRPTQLGE
jgi:hypothetical protein